MKLERRLQQTLDLLKQGPMTAAEIMNSGVSAPSDAVCKLRARGFEIVTIRGQDGRGIYSLLEAGNE